MTPNFYKMYIMFKSCMFILPAWYLVSYSIKNILQIFPKQKFPSVFLFQAGSADRYGRPDPVSRTCTLVHVCRSTRPVARPANPNSLLISVGRPVDRQLIILFPSWGRSTGRSTRAQWLYASSADGRPGRSTAKPASCQRLFPLWWNSEICFRTVFVADFF